MFVSTMSAMEQSEHTDQVLAMMDGSESLAFVFYMAKVGGDSHVVNLENVSAIQTHPRLLWTSSSSFRLQGLSDCPQWII